MHRFSAVEYISADNMDAGTASSNGAIWDEFSEQKKHQSTKKASYSMHNLHFFGRKKR